MFKSDRIFVNGVAVIFLFSAVLANISLSLAEEVLDDEEFLDLIERKAFYFFWNEVNPETGLIKDKAGAFKDDNYSVSSIASVGFGLSAICIAAERGWITKEEAEERVLKTLTFFYENLESVHGFYYHFIDMNTGRRVWKCELSSIDTGLFLAGALTAGEYFGDEAKKLAQKIYERVDWQWMLNKGQTLSMGWKPKDGFLSARWSGYNEGILLYILAIGSPTHPIPADSWQVIARPKFTYNIYTYIHCPCIFTHQYPHIWFDFRNMHDTETDYFENSKIATLAHRQFCIDLSDEFKIYNENCWGITPSLGSDFDNDSKDDYRCWGGPPRPASPQIWEEIDGTVVPAAPAGSIVFTPDLSLAALRYMYDNYKEKIWGRYGFTDAFSLDWQASDNIGIDIGTILLMIENYRTGFVWKYFMQNEAVQRAKELIGFEAQVPEEVVLNLSGKWKISFSDNQEFKKPLFNDEKWPFIDVPGSWEGEGFGDYDGLAWYRYKFVIPEDFAKDWQDKRIVLYIGAIDDADTVYLNGQMIGRLGSFSPEARTAWNRERVYSVPQRLINYETQNVIAVRVEDFEGWGGICNGPVKIGPFAQMQYRPFKLQAQKILLKDLSGKWLFKTGDDLKRAGADCDDSGWVEIQVPLNWEKAGFADYDGFAWYRMHIEIPPTWDRKEKYLYMGSIDDVDEIYFNGKKIGKTGKFPPHYITAWDRKRIYPLPEELIRYGQDNLIAVRVYDEMREGGIRTSPVAIYGEPEW